MSNILIIEDDPAIRSQYALVLQRQGYSVQEARDAKEGLEKLMNVQPNLIILDILLPGSNGITFLRTADIPHSYPGTKVLVASNVESPEFNRDFEELKVDRIIVKSEYTPFGVADVVREMIGA